jgi:NAD(P)-dependent dehydrogenase (short-subunit alcohol dehydrogenase family)
MVVTPMTQMSIDSGAWTDSLENFAKMTPVKRAGKPEDMANAVLWLCDDASGYVTGQLIGVNGGRRID